MQTNAFTRRIFYRLDPGRLFSAIDHLFIYLFIYLTILSVKNTIARLRRLKMYSGDRTIIWKQLRARCGRDNRSGALSLDIGCMVAI